MPGELQSPPALLARLAGSMSDQSGNGELRYAPVRIVPRSQALEPVQRLLPELRLSSSAVVAGAGFLAGAAALATVRAARTRRQLKRGRKRSGRAIERRRVVGTRSFLVDVHLLGR
jgi:hypothetical protein